MKRRTHQHAIEILLKKAKVDNQFKTRLLSDPIAAADDFGFHLSETERLVLSSTPPTTLESMIRNTNVPARFVPELRRSRSAAAITAIVALTASSVTAPLAAPATEGNMDGPLDYSNPTEGAMEQMFIIQDTLEWYREDHGSYPTTETWITSDNPLEEYLDRIMLFDPWERRFHYEGIEEDGIVVNYLLESHGPDGDSPDDNIACPVDPEMHSFASRLTPPETSTEQE